MTTIELAIIVVSYDGCKAGHHVTIPVRIELLLISHNVVKLLGEGGEGWNVKTGLQVHFWRGVS